MQIIFQTSEGQSKKVYHIDVTVLQMPRPYGTFSMILLGKSTYWKSLLDFGLYGDSKSSAYFWMASEGALVASSSYAVHWTLILHYSHALFQLFLSNIPLFTPLCNRTPLKSFWEVLWWTPWMLLPLVLVCFHKESVLRQCQELPSHALKPQCEYLSELHTSNETSHSFACELWTTLDNILSYHQKPQPNSTALLGELVAKEEHAKYDLYPK